MASLCFFLVCIAVCLPQVTGQGQGQGPSLLELLQDPILGTGTGTQQQASPRGNMPTFDLGSLPNTVGRSSINTGTAGSPAGPAAGASQPAVQGHCTAAESQTLFDSCAVSFGMAHMRHFNAMSRLPTCDVKVFSCREVDRLIRCINTQPVNIISNACWPAVPDTLTDFLHRYRLPCTYKDMYDSCQATSAELLPVAQRRQRGRGMSTNPMRSIVQRISMNIAMMVSMMMRGAR